MFFEFHWNSLASLETVLCSHTMLISSLISYVAPLWGTKVRMSCRGHVNIQSKFGFCCLMGPPFSFDYYKFDRVGSFKVDDYWLWHKCQRGNNFRRYSRWLEATSSIFQPQKLTFEVPSWKVTLFTFKTFRRMFVVKVLSVQPLQRSVSTQEGCATILWWKTEIFQQRK